MNNKLHYQYSALQTIQTELAHHPESRLIDLYKLLSQSVFGPGHLIKEPDSARKYLKEELDTFQKYISKFHHTATHQYLSSLKYTYKQSQDDHIICPCLFIDCDIVAPLRRYSLQLIADKVIPFDDFFVAFLQSAEDFTHNQGSGETEFFFINLWQEISSSLNKQSIIDYDKDIAKIDELIANKILLTSHSESYRVTYNPSYRVINKTYLAEYEDVIYEQYFD